jgi:hypothetical protein
MIVLIVKGHSQSQDIHSELGMLAELAEKNDALRIAYPAFLSHAHNFPALTMMARNAFTTKLPFAGGIAKVFVAVAH